MTNPYPTNPYPTPGGLWLPLITPFRDGDLDLASLRRLIAHFAAQPVDGLILAATTGEALTLDADETRTLVDSVAEAGWAVPRFLGLSGSDTRRMTRELAAMRDWQVDGYLISCPSYSRPSQEGLVRHFTALAEATDRPLMIYNIPYRTGVNMGNEAMLRLAALPNVVGVKDCCVNAGQTLDLLRDRPAGFAVLTGEDAGYYEALVHGADGAILASAHVETAGFAAIRRRLLAGDQPGALALWRRLVEVPRLLFAEPSPAAIKHWLWRLGLIDSPELRLPMTPVSAALAARIDRTMHRAG